MRKKLKGFAVPMLVHEIIYADSQYFSLKKETLCNMVVQGLGSMLVHEIIYADSQYFSLKKETLCNMVVQGLGFERLTDIGNDILDKTKILGFNLNDINTELFPEMLKQSRANTESEFVRKIFFTYILGFNLNDINTELFPEMLKQSRANTESEFVRKIFFTYINLHPCLRERILYKSIFMEVEQAILNKKKLKIYFNKKVLDIVPIALERNPETGFNSLKAQVGTEIFLYEMKDIEKILK